MFFVRRDQVRLGGRVAGLVRVDGYRLASLIDADEAIIGQCKDRIDLYLGPQVGGCVCVDS